MRNQSVNAAQQECRRFRRDACWDTLAWVTRTLVGALVTIETQMNVSIRNTLRSVT